MTVSAYIAGLPTNVKNAIKGAFDYPNSTALTASGSTQGTALPLPRDLNQFTTVAAGTGCILPFGVDQIASTQSVAPPGTTQNNYGIAEFGDTFAVINQGANALLVYPQLGGKSSLGGAANAGYSVAAGKGATFQYLGGGNWFSDLSN